MLDFGLVGEEHMETDFISGFEGWDHKGSPGHLFPDASDELQHDVVDFVGLLEVSSPTLP